MRANWLRYPSAVLICMALKISGSTDPSCASEKPDKAEQVFAQMEAKLTQAKTLKCTLDLTETGSKTVSTKGRLVLGEVNKFRLDLNGTVNGEGPKEYAEASDGKLLEIRTNVGTTAHTPTKYLGENWRIYLARGGVYFPMLFSHNANEVQCSKEIHVTDVQLGKAEAFAGKQATVLHYQVQGKGKDSAFKVTVWLDPVTKLPLKREIKFAEKEDLLRIVEIYSNWALDEKLDAKQFTLPEK